MFVSDSVWGLQKMHLRNKGTKRYQYKNRLPGALSSFFTDMDEVAWGFGLANGIGLEVTIDTVLHFAVEGLPQDPFEVLQAMGVVGQAEFTHFRGVLYFWVWHLDSIVKGDHVRFVVDPQHRGGDVLS